MRQLDGVNLPSNLTSISVSEFTDCTSLTTISIPCRVTTVGRGAFGYCPMLTNVVIPSAVTNINQYAFSESGLVSIYFEGNAPAAVEGVFSGDNVTAYYLPDTTGWEEFSTNADIQAVLWNPAIQTSDGKFGVQNDQFGFDITGTANIPIVIEVCTNLASPVWVPLQTCTLTNGLVYFSEAAQTNTSGRYYRIRSP